MSSLLTSRRGDMPSLIIGLIVVLFALGLGAMLFSKVFLAFTTEFKANDNFSNNTVETIELVEQKTIPFMDYLFFFSFIAIAIGLVISAIYLDVPPAFTIIFIIILIIATVIAGVFANVFVTVGEESEISSTYSQFTLTSAIMSNLALVVFVIGIIVVVVLYGKGRSSSPV